MLACANGVSVFFLRRRCLDVVRLSNVHPQTSARLPRASGGELKSSLHVRMCRSHESMSDPQKVSVLLVLGQNLETFMR